MMAATGRLETQLATSEQQMDQLLNSRLREAEERLLTSHGELCGQVADAKQELKAGLAKSEADIQSLTTGFNLVSDMVPQAQPLSPERSKSGVVVGTTAPGPLSQHETVQTPGLSPMKLSSGTEGSGCHEVWSPHSTNGDSPHKPMRQARVLSGNPLAARAVPVRNANSPSNCTSPGHQRTTPKGTNSPKVVSVPVQISGGNNTALGHSQSANAMMTRATVLGSGIDATSPQNARQMSPKGATPLIVTRHTHTFVNNDLDVTMPSGIERRSVSPPTMCVQARHSLGDLGSAKTMPND